MNTVSLLNDHDKGNKKTVVLFVLVLSGVCIFMIITALGAFYMYKTVVEEDVPQIAEQQIYVTNTILPATMGPAPATSTAIYQAAQVRKYDFFDDFSDNDNQWGIGIGKHGASWAGSLVTDGAFVWDVRYPNDKNYAYVYAWEEYRGNKPLADFDMSVDAKLPTTDAQKLCYGVAFRASSMGASSSGYQFYVCDDQYFIVAYNDGTKIYDGMAIVPWTYSNVIRSNNWNTLAVSARNDHFVLSINNTIVSEFTHAWSPNGKVYLMAICFDEVAGTVMFDNFGLQPR